MLHNAVFGEPPIRQVVGDTPSMSPSTSLPSVSPPVDSSTVATESPLPSPAPATHDHTYVTRGGRVVLAFTATTAKLVSAIPNPGYEVRTWHGIGWLRVEFKGGRHHGSSDVIATWNDHEPDVMVRG